MENRSDLVLKFMLKSCKSDSKAINRKLRQHQHTKSYYASQLSECEEKILDLTNQLEEKRIQEEKIIALQKKREQEEKDREERFKAAIKGRLTCGCPLYQPCDICGKHQDRPAPQ